MRNRVVDVGPLQVGVLGGRNETIQGGLMGGGVGRGQVCATVWCGLLSSAYRDRDASVATACNGLIDVVVVVGVGMGVVTN